MFFLSCLSVLEIAPLQTWIPKLWFVFYFFYVIVQQNELSIWVEYLSLKSLKAITVGIYITFSPLSWPAALDPYLLLVSLEILWKSSFKWVPTLFHPNQLVYKSQSVYFTSQIWWCHFVHWDSSIVPSFRYE